MRPLIPLLLAMGGSSPFSKNDNIPSRSELAHHIIDACAAASTPEETAASAAAVIGSMGEEGCYRHLDDELDLPPQGEFKFSVATPFNQRRAVVEEAAAGRRGDGRAMHTLGWLLHGGCGGVERPDARNIPEMRRRNVDWRLATGTSRLNVGGRTRRLKGLCLLTCHHAGLDSFGERSLSFSHQLIVVNSTTRHAANTTLLPSSTAIMGSLNNGRRRTMLLPSQTVTRCSVAFSSDSNKSNKCRVRV